MQPRVIPLKNRPAQFPLVCAPLVARTADELAVEAGAVAARQPGLLEWRVDFFEAIADTGAVLDAAARIREAAAGIPLLFTRRSTFEGGQPTGLDEAQVVELYRAVCASAQVDLVDYEMARDAAHVAAVREMTRSAELPLLLSFHDFQATPGAQALAQRFAQAQSLGGDVAKIAVMPHSMDDVLTLLQATLDASRTLAIPVVSMSMGALGAITRSCGWAFGSAMTFAVGHSSSAPGQMPIEDVETAIALLRKAMQG